MNSTIGPLTLVSSEKGLRSIVFGCCVPEGAIFEPGSSNMVATQLEQYFARERREFDVALNLDGTPFQLAVWQELLRIPYGETRSYGEIARNLGKPGAARAVGMANNANPIPIIIPCHRVIGSDGSLVGFAGGLPTKQKLLAVEGVIFGIEEKAAKGNSTVC